MDQTLLVTSVGTGEYDETTYTLDGVGEYTTDLFPIAIAELLDVDAALVVRTREAGTAYDDRLADEFADLGVDHRTESIPKIDGQDDVDEVLQTLFDAIGDDDDVDGVVLDITHAFRSLPMVFFASVIQLDALGEATLEGMYYGEFQGDQSPVVDLTYLYTLMEWYYSFQTVEKTGSLRGIHESLDRKRVELFKGGEHPTEFASLVDALSGAQRYLDSGLPLEAGVAVADALDALDELDDDDFVGPEGAVLEPLERRLLEFEVRQEVDDKTDIDLDIEEIRRQRDIVEFYRETGRYWIAIECARELFVTRLLHQRDRDEQWLDRETREEHTPSPGHAGSGGEVPEALQLWDRIRDARNMYAHAGYKPGTVQNEQKIDRSLGELCERIDDDEFWREVEL